VVRSSRQRTVKVEQARIFARAILRFAAASGQAIYDPFLGSGTSLIAAEMTGRIGYGLEISPAYVDVVVRRWQDFTGRTARHQASGQLFDERAGT